MREAIADNFARRRWAFLPRIARSRRARSEGNLFGSDRSVEDKPLRAISYAFPIVQRDWFGFPA
jgi:hypothetical protein